MLGRERLWSQGDQFSLFVIWLCQLPGTVTGSCLQLSTALASWIPTPFPSQALPTHTNQGEFHPSGLFHHLCSPQAPLEWHHWPYRAFVGGFAPWHHWLQGVCHLHELQGLSPPGAAGVCHLQGLQGFVTSRGCRGLLSSGIASLSQIHPYLPALKISFFFPFPGLLSCFPAVSTNLQLLPVHLKFRWYFGAHK